VKRLLFLGSVAIALTGIAAGYAMFRAETDAAQRREPTRPSSSRIEHGIIAIGYDAWAGTLPAALSRVTDFAVFHAPEPGPDETARQAYEAGDPSSHSFVYQNLGFACEIESWTTCGFSVSEARRRGFLARYNGREVVLEGVRRAMDAGKPGYGRAVAQAFADRLAVLWPRPDGVFIDDVNVVDSRLPRNGVPDGYTVDTYRAALKAQLAAAINELERLGYKTMANLGGVDAGEFQLSGLAEFTFLEFCGAWGDGTAQYDAAAGRDVVADRIEAAINLARSRGRHSVCQSFGAVPARGRLARADAVTLADDNDYRAPFQVFIPQDHVAPR
jgi:hypothetical protein